MKAVAVALIAVVLVLILKKGDSGIAQLLSVLVCCMILGAALSLFRPIAEFLTDVQSLGGMDGQYYTILLKAVGVSVTAEIASLLCSDSGNAAMGKTIQFLATAVIVSLSLPLMNAFLQLIEGIVDAL